MEKIPKFDLQKAAIRVCQYTERRNYTGNAKLQSSAFGQEIGHLVSELNEAIQEVAVRISSHYTIHLDTSTTFGLFLKEKGAEENLVECYLDTSSPPRLSLLFLGSGVEKSEERLVLAPGLWALSSYLWYSRTKQLFNAYLLAQFCVDQVFRTAIVVLKEATQNDPVDQLQGEQND